jgi:hypothetical protein
MTTHQPQSHSLSCKKSIVLACVGLILTILSVWTIDPALTLWLNHHLSSHSLVLFAQIVCVPFDTSLWLLVSFVMFVLVSVWAYQNKLTTEKKRIIAAFFITFFCLLIVTTILKISLGRARPYMLIQDHISGFFPFMNQYNYYSMPSGHITAAVFLCGGLFLWTRSPLLRILAIVLTLIVTAARIILFKHFLGDAFISITISLLFFSYSNCMATIWLTCIKRISQHFHQPGLR